MSTRIPARRIGQCAFAAFKPAPAYRTATQQLPLRARRTLTTTPCLQARKDKDKGIISVQEKDTIVAQEKETTPVQTQETTPQKSQPKEPEISNPILEKYLEKERQQSKKKIEAPTPREGGLSKQSIKIFKGAYVDETPIPRPSDPTPEALRKWKADVKEHRKQAAAKEEFRLSALKLDPDPWGRRNWERKRIITSLRKRGRLTKAMQLKRVERESRYKSPFLPTSVKKLTKLMNQIAGKTVDEALVQLRFSKKKVARDVWKGLKMARDEAIVARGMGLGEQPVEHTAEELKDRREQATKAKGEQNVAKEKKEANPDQPATSATTLKAGPRSLKQTAKPMLIELKDGKSKRIDDPTEMYVDQAWVGRGPPTKSPEFRARGKVNMLTHRVTSFSVLLKEEKTRMRISEEIKKKRASRKLWVALPDRPVTAQRQYCLW